MEKNQYLLTIGYDMSAANNIVKISNLKNIWGQGIEEPIVCVEDVRITKDRIALLSRDKNPTLKITLPNGVELIKFKSSEDEFINLYADEGSININAIGKCSANTFNSTTTAQIIIDDYEIVGKQNYFF